MQPFVFAAEQSDDRETNRVRTTRGASGEDSVGPVVEGWSADQVEVSGSVELPDNEKGGETFNVGDPDLEFRQHAEYPFCFMPGVQTFRDFSCIVVRAADESNRTGNKHTRSRLPLP